MRKMNFYGTLGPSCSDFKTLVAMFREGMTGVRLNLSHVTLQEAAGQIAIFHQAAEAAGAEAELLIDMQGPELRIGPLGEPLELKPDDRLQVIADSDGGQKTTFLQTGLSQTGLSQTALSQSMLVVTVPRCVMEYLNLGQEVLLDDGKIAGIVETISGAGIVESVSEAGSVENVNEAESGNEPQKEPATESGNESQKETATESGNEPGKAVIRITRGGILQGRKSLALPGVEIPTPALTRQDLENLQSAVSLGVTGVMQPFVRSKEDLLELRQAMRDAGCGNLKIFAKIENLCGVENLKDFFAVADEIVIARGDLGNSMPLWQLPRIQKQIAGECLEAGMPFMVVTQMLASMEHAAVPTRAEVSDIYNAVMDGATSLMVTGETAVGEYPTEVMRYLVNTAKEATGE